MAGALIVDPAVYGAASSTAGVLAGGSLRSAAHGVSDVLSGAGGMAGSDPAAARWAAAYDDAAASVVETSQRLINGCNVLAELLEQTGYNYARAELASAGAPPPLDRTDYLAQAVSLAAPPSAAGSSPVGPPTGWSLIESAVGRVWPNGHQDRMRRAAAAWHDGACFLYDAAHYLADAVAQVAQQVAPETDAVIAVCNSLRDGIESAAEIYKALGVACADFAADIDQARSAAEHELASLLEWTAGIEIAGAALTVLTFGASEVVSQGAVIARIGVTAARVAAIIDRLMAAAVAAGESASMLAARAAETGRLVNPVLQLKRVAALVDVVPLARASAAAQRAYLIELDRAAAAVSVDLSAVPVQARAEILDALERARTGKVRFSGHDGKRFENIPPIAPTGHSYTEWTAAPSGAHRGVDRIIIAGDPSNPVAVYYWDHATNVIWIGPVN